MSEKFLTPEKQIQPENIDLDKTLAELSTHTAYQKKIKKLLITLFFINN